MNTLSPELLAQLFSQESNDPFLMLVTLNHSSMPQPLYFCANAVEVISNGITFLPFPVKIVLAPDDGESSREIQMIFDNVSREIIDELRTVTDPIEVQIDMVLASNPNYIQLSILDLKIKSINYDRQKINAKLYLDNFLTVGLPSEKYVPSQYKGLF
jgi:hypothetical protein